MKKVEYAKEAKKRRIRRRNPVGSGSVIRPMMARVRMRRRISTELASIQGLCYAFGKRETLAELFEEVAMPAIRSFAKKYAKKARVAR